jgi:hypothetical protein
LISIGITPTNLNFTCCMTGCLSLWVPPAHRQPLVCYARLG